jgi:site-specific DNA recombinase
MRESPKTQELRCAIYTRKSSEEGLEQDFNSLHAQREACQAYIKSQKHEGWRPLAAHYDDGGYSGGTMDRPALRRLLTDIRAKRIDTVVVYKVDRLTRSLADFAKIVEVFDASGVSFVSVTQAFNTTTSMGRLTLNVLLSFAQFEREVTGERIRDKIAASKKKGLWMGGFVPFGYRAKDRTLTIDKDEAETIRLIHSRYLQLGTVSALEAELAERNLRTRGFISANSNKAWGDRPFSRGHLYKILSNPIYAGKIVHSDKHYDGQHEAIIDRRTFAAVQAQLAANNRQHRRRARAKEPNLLAGLLFDSKGNPLTSSHTVKNGKRYRYYLGTRTEQGRPKPWRLPAHEIESAVLKAARDFLGDRQRVATALKRSRLQARKLKHALEIATDLSAQINAIHCPRETALKLIKQVVVSDSQLAIEVKLEALMSDDGRVPGTVTHRLTIPIDLGQQNGGAIVIASASERRVKTDPALVKALARGFVWFEEMATGGAATVTSSAKRERVTDRYVSRLVELAFIDPRIIERVLAGTARSTISTTRLVFKMELPHLWSDQANVIFGATKKPRAALAHRAY